MTGALVTLLAVLAVAVLSGLVARWSLQRWPTNDSIPVGLDPLDPEGNQAAVTRAVSVAARKVAP